MCALDELPGAATIFGFSGQTSRWPSHILLLLLDNWLFVSSCRPLKEFFYLYHVRLDVEIRDINSPYTLTVHSKLLISLTLRFLWAANNRVSDCSIVLWCPRWFRLSGGQSSLSIWGYKQSHRFEKFLPIWRSLSGQQKSKHRNRSLYCKWVPWIEDSQKRPQLNFCSVVFDI